MEGAVVERVVLAGNVRPLIAGTRDVDALEVPVVSRDVKTIRILNPRSRREREVEYGPPTIGGNDVNGFAAAAGFAEGNRIFGG